MAYVKAHGALYNQAVKNEAIANAIAEGVGRWRRDVVLVGLAGSQMLDVFRRAAFAWQRKLSRTAVMNRTARCGTGVLPML